MPHESKIEMTVSNADGERRSTCTDVEDAVSAVLREDEGATVSIEDDGERVIHTRANDDTASKVETKIGDIIKTIVAERRPPDPEPPKANKATPRKARAPEVKPKAKARQTKPKTV